MNKDQSKVIIITGLSIFLIVITWTAMGWPLDFTDLLFWIFVFVAFLEVVLIIFANELIKRKLKKKKKKDSKRLQTLNNIYLIIGVIFSSLLIFAISGIVWGVNELNQYKEIYPAGTMTYKLEDYDKELIVPSYSVIDGEYWDELIVFRSPKSADKLEEELAEIFNSVPFDQYETEDGMVYYNSKEDYTIISYEVHENLFMNSFNLVYCDGYCA